MSESPNVYQKTLPEITTITRPFWDAAKRHELVLQRCAKCAHYQFYPKPWCSHCGSRTLEWAKVSGKGVVYSFTVIRQVIGNAPAFQADIPFAIAEVDLEEGPRIYGNVIGVKLEDVRVGAQVQVVFEDVTPDISLTRFKLA